MNPDDLRNQRLCSRLPIRLVAKHLRLSVSYLSMLERGLRAWTPRLEAQYVNAVKLLRK